MVTPGSRFRDDLYISYVVVLLWFTVPSYGRALALVLPSDVHNFEGGLDLLAVGASVIALWWGAQGGPLTVSRAAVTHELGSPVSRIALLLPRLARQALMVGTFVGVGGALLLAINGGASDGFSAPALVSLVCALGAAATVFQAAIWLVVTHARGGPRWPLAVAALVGPGAVAAFVFTWGSLSTAAGLGLLAAVAVYSGIVGVLALRWVPVDRLWQRATAMESVRSAMQVFDFQRVLLDLRRASDRPQPGGLRLARTWMPTALWRQLAAMQHGIGKHLVRLCVAGLALAALVYFGNARDGLVILAIAACGATIGLELSGSLAATADQSVFVLHYRRGSAVVLLTQWITMLLLALLVGGLAVGGQWGASPREVLAAALLCGYGAMGAALQARLGSPNLAKFVDVIGFEWVGPLLWGRAMAGPAVLLLATVALSRQLWHPPADGAQTWVVIATLTAAVAAVVATRPLETKAP